MSIWMILLLIVLSPILLFCSIIALIFAIMILMILFAAVFVPVYSILFYIYQGIKTLILKGKAVFRHGKKQKDRHDVQDLSK